MTVTNYKWSISKWHELVNSGVLAEQKVELLEGEIVEMSPEGIEHSATNENVVIYLRNILSDIAHVKESHPVTLDNSEPEPDIAVVRLPIKTYLTRHPHAEDIYWLIEVSKKTLKKDLEQKTLTYARNGIPEYWVIDLINHKVIVHTQPNKSQYFQIIEYRSGSIKPLAFPNVEIPLDRLLLY